MNSKFDSYNLFALMIYSLPFYLAFSMLAILIIGAQKKETARHFWLFICNLAFLYFVFFFHPIYLVFLIAFLLLDFALLMTIRRLPANSRKLLVAFVIILNLAFLIYFNYPKSTPMLPRPGQLAFIMVGSAFWMLRVLHIAFELSTDSLKQPLSLLRYFNYVLFFPAFLSGPIAHYDPFTAQVARSVRPDSKAVYQSVRRLIIGSFKFQFLAMLLYPFTLDQLSDGDLSAMKTWMILLSLASYTVWLYLSFSGITDIAIAIGALLGIELPENFNRPFLAVNLQDFWKRWHISLLEWIRSYVFMPILGIIYSILPSKPVVSTMIVTTVCFVLLGVWHGDDLHFLHYGIYHALGLMIFYFCTIYLPKNPAFLTDRLGMLQKTGRCAAWVLTWSYISFGWFFYLGRETALHHFLEKILR